MPSRLSVIFIVLIVLQLVFSFVYPAFEQGSECWKPLGELASDLRYPLTGSDNKLFGVFKSLFPNFHLNCDGGGYLLLAQDFPQDYFDGKTIFLGKPFWPAMIALTSLPLRLVSDSYATLFATAIILNFTLFFISVALFYSLVKRYVSRRTAFWSAVLLIFSPFAHVWLVQPVPDILGVFMVIASLYLLDNYLRRPSRIKLVYYSLFVGVLMLSKFFIAIGFFIVGLSFVKKRCLEGLSSLAVQFVPMILWYLLVTQVWGLGFYNHEISAYRYGVWVVDLIGQPLKDATLPFIDALPRFITSVLHAFLVVPVIFSIVGLIKTRVERKYLIYGGLTASLFALLFILNLYLSRHAFLLFPVVYPTAVIGVEVISQQLSKQRSTQEKIRFLTILIIILISSLNIYPSSMF